MRKQALLLAPVLGAVALGLLLWGRRDGGDARPADAAPAALRWEAGARQAYRVATDATMQMGFSGTAATGARVAGVLALDVLAVDGTGGARARFRLAPASWTAAGGPDQAAELGLDTPFEVAFDGEGRPVRFDFPATLPDGGRVVLEQLIRTFQVVVPRGAAGRWTCREENGTGRYVAQYRDAGGGILVKEKRVFEESAGTADLPGPVAVEVPLSRAVVRLAPGTSWVDAVTLDERIRIRARGEVVMEAALRASLARLPFVPEAPPPAAPSASAPAVDPAAACARLLAEVAASGGTGVAPVHGLRDLLRAHPETAARVADALRAGGLDEATAAALANALGLAGTPEAQAALGGILGDAAGGRTDRLRAAIALGGVERPTPAALDSLWRASERRDAGVAREVAHTALLALGALAPKADAVGARLAERLAAAADEDEAGILLGALGNTRDPAFAATVAPWLDDASAYVRGAAADALGNLPAPENEARLVARLQGERDPRVRAALAAALNRVPDPSPATLATVLALAPVEETASARLELARLLGAHLDALPDARATLERMLVKERSARVRTVLGRALLRTG